MTIPALPTTALQNATERLIEDAKQRGVPTLRTTFDVDGNAQRTWYFQGKECAKVELPLTGLPKQYAAFTLILEDLKDVERWLQMGHRLLTDQGFTAPSATDRTVPSLPDDQGHLLKALMFAAITCYGKCFASTEGRGGKLEERDHVPAACVTKHREIVELRNQLTAHAGMHPNKHAEFAQPVIVHPPVGHNGVPIARVEMTRLEFIDDRNDPVPFLSLVAGVAANVTTKIIDLEKRLGLKARA